jgi:hypothetical protein
MTAAPTPAPIGRLGVAAGILAAGLVFLALDIASSAPLDPFSAPPPAAFGSGAAPQAAHCAAPPAIR